MGFIFVTEVAQGGQHWVGRGLSQAAQGVILNIVAQLFHLIDIFHGAGAGGDLIQHFQQALGAHAAGSTLTAGFVNSELQEELGDIQPYRWSRP